MTEIGNRSKLSHELVPWIILLVLGTAISTLPHLIAWPQVHQPIWLAGNDEIIYLTVAAPSYYEHPLWLSDPIQSSPRPTIYPWLLFVPAIVAAKVIRLGPLGISLIWRVWAGATVAAGWFVVTRKLVTPANEVDAGRGRWLAAGITAVLLCDCGVMRYAPFIRQLAVIVALARGGGSDLYNVCYPKLLEQWKIISPAVYLGFLLLHIWLVARARESHSWIRIVLAAASLGLLFVYFYLWTAALAGLIIAALLEREHRSMYLGILGLGFLCGLPAIISGVHFRHIAAPDWFARNNFFAAGEPRPALRWGNLVLYPLTFFWLRRVARQLVYLWSLAFGAWLLFFVQPIIFHRSIQNFHWLNVRNPLLTALLLLLFAETITRTGKWSRGVVITAVALCVADMTGGVWLRVEEARKSLPAGQFVRTYQEYQQQFSSDPLRLQRDAVIAGDPAFASLATILNDARPLSGNAALVSPSLSDAEWISRTALNDYASGIGPNDLDEAFRPIYLKFRVEHPELPWVVNAARWASYVAHRRAAYAEIAADPEEWFDRFGVKYVALKVGNRTPAYLNSGWEPLVQGPHWNIWRRSGPLPAATLRVGANNRTSQPTQSTPSSCCLF